MESPEKPENQLNGYPLLNALLKYAGPNDPEKIAHAQKMDLIPNIWKMPLKEFRDQQVNSPHDAIEFIFENEPAKKEAYFLGRIVSRIKAVYNLHVSRGKGREDGGMQHQLDETLKTLKQHPAYQAEPTIAQISEEYSHITSSHENELQSCCVHDADFCQTWLRQIHSHLESGESFSRDAYQKLVIQPGIEATAKNTERRAREKESSYIGRIAGHVEAIFLECSYIERPGEKEINKQEQLHDTLRALVRHPIYQDNPKIARLSSHSNNLTNDEIELRSCCVHDADFCQAWLRQIHLHLQSGESFSRDTYKQLVIEPGIEASKRNQERRACEKEAQDALRLKSPPPPRPHPYCNSDANPTVQIPHARS